VKLSSQSLSLSLSLTHTHTRARTLSPLVLFAEYGGAATPLSRSSAGGRVFVTAGARVGSISEAFTFSWPLSLAPFADFSSGEAAAGGYTGSKVKLVPFAVLFHTEFPSTRQQR
jgi:hypothetical protein